MIFFARQQRAIQDSHEMDASLPQRPRRLGRDRDSSRLQPAVALMEWQRCRHLRGKGDRCADRRESLDPLLIAPVIRLLARDDVFDLDW